MKSGLPGGRRKPVGVRFGSEWDNVLQLYQTSIKPHLTDTLLAQIVSLSDATLRAMDRLKRTLI